MVFIEYVPEDEILPKDQVDDQNNIISIRNIVSTWIKENKIELLKGKDGK